jgi:hypothetical protein
MFSKHQGTLKGGRLSVIIHVLGKNVLEDKAYQEWMNTFPSDVQVRYSTMRVFMLLETNHISNT